jgi:hypothetical protein
MEKLTQINADILEVIRTLPGITREEIIELMPDTPPGTVASTLTKLERRGLVTVAGKPSPKPKGRRTIKSYTVSTNPNPVAAPVRKLKNRTPTATGYEARIEALNAKIAELESWKADAIKRYPDLAVPPEMLTARKIIAETLGDKTALHGGFDNAPIMRATLRALEMAA